MVTHDRRSDIYGVLVAALGIVLLVTLALGQGGLVGNTLHSIFSALFGRAAWLVPIGLMVLGAGMVAGKYEWEIGRVTAGLGILALSVVAAMSQSRNGDYFDPEVIAGSGGYFGALIAWGFKALLGSAQWVGIGALGMVGLILTLDRPLRSVGELLRRPAPSRETVTPRVNRRRPLDEDDEDISAPDPKQDRKRALREALLNARSAPAPVEDEDEAKGNRTVLPAQKTKPMPLLRDMNAGETVSLDAKNKEGYTLPPLSILKEPTIRTKRAQEEVQGNIVTLENTLLEFGIEANVVEIATGPTITRYEVQLGPGIRVNRITTLADNIAMSMAASHVRVEAPIPGKNAIGVEVPNEKPVVVSLRELCETKEFGENPSRLLVGLGQDVSGRNKYADLTRMPHLLIGGATNSGKSIGLATIITSLLMRNTPKDLRMVMIDPKRVELSLFDGIPHLMCPVVKDVKEAPGVLRAIWREMDIRYDLFSERGVRNIDGWNSKASFAERLPYIVVVIDELADLMIQAAAEVETSIVRLAQLARAVGIHLVIATQRPSVDVITGLIKANIPSRIAFAVSSQIDSRTILDQGGAEKLVGKGDMLFLPIDANKPTRIQGCYVSEREIEEVCKHWIDQEKPLYVLNPIAVAINDKEGEMRESEEADAHWEEAVRWVADRGQASTSMLQRKFSIGFQRASRLLDMMEERGIVGPRDGPRPREVLVDPMEVEQMFGRATGPSIDIDPLD